MHFLVLDSIYFPKWDTYLLWVTLTRVFAFPWYAETSNLLNLKYDRLNNIKGDSKKNKDE